MGACIVCGTERVSMCLDLGSMALANKFLTKEELSASEPSYPLAVGWCHNCAHLQLMDHVPPSAMFTDYLYLSSASTTLTRHLMELSTLVVAQAKLGSSDLVVDIGCNDGTLLQGFQRYGVRTLGVDPAANLAVQGPVDPPTLTGGAVPTSRFARSRPPIPPRPDRRAPPTNALVGGRGSLGGGVEQQPIPRYVDFFNARTAREIRQRWGPARAITITNTFPHIPAVRDFVEGLKTALAPDGLVVIETHYLLDLLDQIAFDTIYHEHVSYWALGPMVRLCEAAGLQVVDAQRLPIHHGQLRVVVQHAGRGRAESTVSRLLDLERASGLGQFRTYQAFADRVHRLKRALGGFVEDLRARGCRLAGYGAPAKGNTLLGFLGWGPDVMDYIVDRNPLKQGRYTPGTHIPVVAPDRLLEDQPDYVMLLAWNFAEEIMAQQAEYLRRGGKFIIPVPAVRVVGEEGAALGVRELEVEGEATR